MQLGTRWAAGTPVPRAVPVALHPAIAAAELTEPAGGSWTLTFLEGRAIAELDAGIEIVENADGTTTTSRFTV